MDKQDKYIKAQMQQDKKISNKANEIFQNFERRIEMEENNKPKEKKVIKLSLQHAVLAFTSLMIVVVLGGNLYAHIKGKPNIYSAIKGLFVKEDKYVASEIVVDQTVESNGIKLTLKTVAMDENILITKYVASGEKLANEFYAYQEFEEDVIELVKINLALAEWDIMKDDPEYKDVTSKDAVVQTQLISKRLSIANLTEAEEEALMKIAKKAYQEFIILELSPENSSEKKVNELIEETIAMFESKVNSKYDVMSVDTKLQEFGIQTISQKVEKSGNEYIIYNVYNVDTISDLASKFNLSVNVNKIGNVEGKWNFSTELEKARLDTRVETIDFYSNEVDVYGNDRDGYIKVSVKKLIISDFSSVLMVQKNSDYYMDGTTESLLKNTYTYVVTDDNENILGTGGTVKAENVYADRIILENVDINTKILNVKVYSNIDNELLKTITINVEEARQEKHVELNQRLYNESHGISLQYPGDWTQPEKVSVDQEAILHSPSDVDGERASIVIEKIPVKDIESGKVGLENPDEFKDVVKSSITIAGYTGENYEYSYAENRKERQIRIEKDDEMYFIRYAGTVTQFERYYATFEEILKTIVFLQPQKPEPEKSYTAYYTNGSSDSFETVKVYEDKTITVQISEYAREIWDKDISTPRIQSNVEYEIRGVDSKIRGIEFLKAVEGGGYVGSCIFIHGENNELYLVDMHKGILTGKFEAKEIELENGYWGGVYCEAIRDQEGYEKLITFVQDSEGQKYIISRDGTVEKYVESEQPKYDETVSISITKEFNTAEYDSIKKWSDGKITIEFTEGVNSYKDAKTANIKTDGTSYRIYGIEGDIQNIYRLRNAYVGIYDALPAYVFEVKNKQNKTDIYLITLADLSEYFTAKGPLVSDVSEYTYIQDNGIEVITNNSEGYEIRYEGVETVGKVPTKQEIYNIIDEYVTNLGEDGKKAPDLYDTKNYVNISLSKSNNNYSKIIVNVNRKEYLNGQKEIWAAIEFDETEQEWKVVDFRLQARGGV